MEDGEWNLLEDSSRISQGVPLVVELMCFKSVLMFYYIMLYL